MESIGVLARSLSSEPLRAILEAWAKAANGRIGPRREELSPAKLRKATAFTFTVDLVEDGKDFRFGFAGEKVLEFLARRCAAPTLTGMRGTRFFDDAEMLMRQCVTRAHPVISTPRQTTYSGREYLEREVLLVPLSHDGMRLSGLLGGLDTWLLGAHGRQVC